MGAKAEVVQSAIDQCKLKGADRAIDQCKLEGADRVIDQCNLEGADTVIDQCKLEGVDSAIDQCKLKGVESSFAECVGRPRHPGIIVDAASTTRADLVHVEDDFINLILNCQFVYYPSFTQRPVDA